MRRMKRLGWALASAMVVAACGDSGETGGGGSGAGEDGGGGATGGGGSTSTGGNDAVPAAHVAACEAQETLICEKFFECGSSGLGEHYYGDVAGCVADRAALCVTLYRPDGATAEDIDACTAALGDPTCDDFVRYYYDGLGWTGYPEECVYRGERAEGEACETLEQCASGICSFETDGCGVCEPEPGEGDTCSSSCALGLSCIDGTCIVLGDVGDTCDPLTPCHSASWCDGGTCAEVLREGDACDPDNVGCSYQFPVCSPLDPVCAANGPAAEVGEPCWVAEDGSFNLCHDAHCEISAATGEGTCVVTAEVGEECRNTGDIVFSRSTCDVGLLCVAGSCVAVGEFLSCD